MTPEDEWNTAPGALPGAVHPQRGTHVQMYFGTLPMLDAYDLVQSDARDEKGQYFLDEWESNYRRDSLEPLY